ncbi:MAG: glycosyl hydrolase [Phormidesmis sp.]
MTKIKQNWLRGLQGTLSLLAILFFTNHAWAQPASLLLGIYPPDFVGDAAVLRNQVQAVDTWIGKQHSLVGLFYDLEAPNPAYDIPTALNRLQDNDYTAFINLTSRHSAADIADGAIDRAIEKTARAYGEWARQAETPLVFMAPLPEMNGAWEIYGHTPEDFKRAYAHIREIFVAADIPEGSVRWVFAPNGWSTPEHGFERYYPGPQSVDVVSFSAYNWGYCENASWKQWQSPETVFSPYVDRMKKMAPGKPIFIAQTASTSVNRGGRSAAQKNAWLAGAYQHLAESGVKAVMYFNIEKECDWAVFKARQIAVEGYRQATNIPAVGYQSPEEIAEAIPLTE